MSPLRLLTPGLFTPKPFAPGLFTPKPFAPGLLAPEPFTPGLLTRGPFTPGLFAPKPFTLGLLTRGPFTPGPRLPPPTPRAPPLPSPLAPRPRLLLDRPPSAISGRSISGRPGLCSGSGLRRRRSVSDRIGHGESARTIELAGAPPLLHPPLTTPIPPASSLELALLSARAASSPPTVSCGPPLDACWPPRETPEALACGLSPRSAPRRTQRSRAAAAAAAAAISAAACACADLAASASSARTSSSATCSARRRSSVRRRLASAASAGVPRRLNGRSNTKLRKASARRQAEGEAACPVAAEGKTRGGQAGPLVFADCPSAHSAALAQRIRRPPARNASLLHPPFVGAPLRLEAPFPPHTCVGATLHPATATTARDLFIRHRPPHRATRHFLPHRGFVPGLHTPRVRDYRLVFLSPHPDRHPGHRTFCFGADLSITPKPKQERPAEAARRLPRRMCLLTGGEAQAEPIGPGLTGTELRGHTLPRACHGWVLTVKNRQA
eukprot:scaffold6567_cov73-Isochrysis_galbana.AAC.3